MKVYIDEKNNGKTVTFELENGKKQKLYVHDNEGFIFKDLADYTKQVRKEMCEKLREWARKQIIYCGGKATETDVLTANASNQVLDDLKEFLDQIQGE